MKERDSPLPLKKHQLRRSPNGLAHIQVYHGSGFCQSGEHLSSTRRDGAPPHEVRYHQLSAAGGPDWSGLATSGSRDKEGGSSLRSTQPTSVENSPNSLRPLSLCGPSYRFARAVLHARVESYPEKSNFLIPGQASACRSADLPNLHICARKRGRSPEKVRSGRILRPPG